MSGTQEKSLGIIIVGGFARVFLLSLLDYISAENL